MSTHNIPFSTIKKKITLIIPKSETKGFFLGTQEQVRNSRGKRAISVRATEVLLYSEFISIIVQIISTFLHFIIEEFISLFTSSQCKL